jgi:hypothetical protein
MKIAEIEESKSSEMQKAIAQRVVADFKSWIEALEQLKQQGLSKPLQEDKSTYKLYAWTDSHFYLYTCLMAADANKQNIELIVPDQKLKEDPEFKAKKGHGQYPMLETPDGKILFESVAIARYLLNMKSGRDMLGKGPF